MEESLASVNEHMRTGPTQFARSLQAEHALLEGRPEAACDLLEPLYDSTWQGSDAPMLAWAYADLDQPDRANAALEPYLARANAERDVVASIAGWQAQAILFLRLHRWQEATEQLEQVIASCRRLPYPYAEAKALYVYGQLHVAQGEQDSARMRFAAALTILSRLGERLYAQQIKRALELIS
jgi:tetratricopeptide (TPR) repeat protein